jgi:hypothetical protein
MSLPPGKLGARVPTSGSNQAAQRRGGQPSHLIQLQATSASGFQAHQVHQTTIVEENENMAPSERVQIEIQYGAKTPVNPV